MLMVGTGYFVETAPAVAVACRLYVGVRAVYYVASAPTASAFYPYLYLACLYVFYTAKQGGQVRVQATDFL
jgi:hypothetical protein